MFKYLLTLDLDDRFNYNTIMDTLTSLVVLYRMLNIKTERIRIYISSNKRGYHFEILVSSPRRLSDIEIVLLQAILGDDPRRSIHNYYKVLNNKPYNVLFNVKNGKRRIYDKKLSRLVSQLYSIMINFSEKLREKFEEKKEELFSLFSK